ncbi:MAG: DUF417 family protein [Chitinophagaceae bacterium]
MTTIIQNERGAKLERLGTAVLRYGIVIILLWVGLLKFTAYEAKGVHGHASNSPLLSWAYGLMSVQNFSIALGVVEITLAILIAVRPVAPKASAVGSIGVIIMSLITLSFLLTTPGVWQPGYGFPSLSPNPGQFLAKDLLLLGAAIYTAGEALKASNSRVSTDKIAMHTKIDHSYS